MASSDTLRTQVAQALDCSTTDKAIDRAIRVVLAAVAEQIEAEREPDHYLGSNAAVIDRVLAVVARLGEVSDGK